MVSATLPAESDPGPDDGPGDEPDVRATDRPGLANLTDREREVTRLVGGVLSDAEIAERLFISPSTAKTHVNRAMMKVGARDRAQLVVLAYETGLVSPGGR